ncbi:FCD domain-containing protein [Mycolicibacterium hodleri]|uniref:FCD domain-containing protein n=1 Tax=Mycolicibacterium hodleri TaxID=49897 RepID=A0A502E7Z0_9MYCO|nr:FCD domain-containing protein [Mycolicibacterium hodleri]TPG32992.1 FCD domain-containing protein [Mycolicibacterium hodleri]
MGAVDAAAAPSPRQVSRAERFSPARDALSPADDGPENHSCGNEDLRQQAFALRRVLQPYRRLQLRVPDRMRRSMAEHRTIADAIARGDASAADTAARDHVLVQVKKFSNLVRTWRQLSAS